MAAPSGQSTETGLNGSEDISKEMKMKEPARTLTHVRTRTHTHTHKRSHTHTHTTHTHARTHARTHAHTHAHTHTHIHLLAIFKTAFMSFTRGPCSKSNLLLRVFHSKNYNECQKIPVPEHLQLFPPFPSPSLPPSL